MGAQALLAGALVAGCIIWIIELIWLYRQADLDGEDPIGVVSGAALFFVLAVPVAIVFPGVVDGLAAFWQRVTGVQRLLGRQKETVPRLMVGEKIFALTEGRFQIGRYPNNDLVLDHPTVSAYHAEIMLRGDGRYEILDRGSHNGVRINGNKVRSAILRDGDLITLGAVTIHYLIRPAQARERQPSAASPGQRHPG